MYIDMRVEPKQTMLRREWIRRFSAGMCALGASLWGRPLRATVSRPHSIFVLRNPGCPCCVPWAEHVREHGFQVQLHDSPDLDGVKARLGIPEDLQSCHTGIVEGYIVEGHVPGRFIRQLLHEAPEIAGIAVPGMPSGAPGMEGPNPEPFDVVAFGGSNGAGRYVLGRVTP